MAKQRLQDLHASISERQSSQSSKNHNHSHRATRIRLEKYVYHAGAGTPPGREGVHTSTESVTLHARIPLSAQWTALTHDSRARVFALCDATAPHLWSDPSHVSARRELKSDEARTPNIIFRLCRKVAVVLPLHGMD